jgi:YbgC/YbaW family acyl-CoA thioester hydrolase
MLNKQVHQYEVLITEKHLDTFGHVNNATYLELYEEARWDLITNNGWGLDKIKKTGIGPVVTSINIQYKRELTNREKVIIETTFGEFRNSKICSLNQQMIKEDGTVANVMKLEAGLFDLGQRKLIDPTDEWLRALGVEGEWKQLL